MSTLLFSLRGVPDDEADEIRELLTANNIDYYETSAGNWGISMPALWVSNNEQVFEAQKLLNQYHQQRAITQREIYNQLKKEGDNSRLAFSNIEEEDKEILNKLDSDQEVLLKIRTQLDSLKSNRFAFQADLNNLKNELDGFKKLGNVDYSSIKEAWEKKENCELCGSSIFNHWEERVKEGCPSCGTLWKNIPKTIQELISNGRKNNGKETRDIQTEIEKIELELRTTQEDIERLEKDEKTNNVSVKNLREKLATNNSRRRKLQSQNDVITQKIHRIGVELGSLSAQEKMVNQDESIGLLKVNLEKINTELENYYTQLDRYEHELPEQEELQQILNNFTRSTKEIFGYSMLADTDTRIITISKDDSERDFEAMSWSERYFIDVVFRISVFNFLIENGIMKKGFLVLDSPEAALDPHRLDLLANLINKHKNKITFTIATRVSKFFNQLEGNPLEIRKQTQTSLFDFISMS